VRLVNGSNGGAFSGLATDVPLVRYISTNDLVGAAYEADVLQALMYTPAQIARTVEVIQCGQDFDVSHTTPPGEVEAKAKPDDTPLTSYEFSQDLL
jgi:hypothetical protein